MSTSVSLDTLCSLVQEGCTCLLNDDTKIFFLSACIPCVFRQVRLVTRLLSDPRRTMMTRSDCGNSDDATEELRADEKKKLEARERKRANALKGWDEEALWPLNRIFQAGSTLSSAEYAAWYYWDDGVSSSSSVSGLKKKKKRRKRRRRPTAWRRSSAVPHARHVRDALGRFVSGFFGDYVPGSHLFGSGVA